MPELTQPAPSTDWFVLLKRKIKSHPALFKLAKAIRSPSFPVIPVIHSLLYFFHSVGLRFLVRLWEIVYSTPLFKSRLANKPGGLYLYSGIPLITGPLHIEVGNDCRISGITTFSGRTSSIQPKLIIGNNVGIGWQVNIAVGTEVRIGNNARLAGKVYLAGYSGHPIDPTARAAGLPEPDESAKPIYIEDNVWLATGVTVLAGVRIGANTIVGANSVVTHDLPANVIAAGMPAKIIRHITESGARHD